ncbi:autotransporter assembly complex protein TamA [Massilia glaciei]|uniref:Bacterial surface antigen (D15) domain-containing protein n=1 Tax=Massilia glaciei TaxID=1524097 RepID=A0A2U2HM32_9BURK|nr:BamA/TamA family outer membrane protein [Massilia glaciei]PWF48485.1 hypothetical protein C7C56_011660 [Massilia glaciei]
MVCTDKPNRRWTYRAAHLLAGIALAAAVQPALAAFIVELDVPADLREPLTEHLDLLRYRDRDDIDAQQLDFMVGAAPEQVQRLVSTAGYFSPKTTVRVERRNGNVVVLLAVDPGLRTAVARLDIGVRGAAATRSPEQIERLRRDWDLPVGAPFRQAAWADAKQEGLNVLRARRYAAARIAGSEAVINADRQQAWLGVTYDSGPLFSIGPTVVDGARRYPASIAENLNPLARGEDYNLDRLREYQRQLLRTPYYSHATVDIGRDPALAGAAPVLVELTENPLQRLRAGIGYTSDTGASLSGLYSHNSLWRPGLAFESELVLEQRRQLARAALALPPRPGGFILSVRAFTEQTRLEGVEQLSRQIGVQRARHGERRDTEYALTYYRDRLKRLDDAELPADVVVLPGDHQATVASVARTWRRVDDPVFPRSGYTVSAQLGAALKGLLTDQSFVRGYASANFYRPLGRRHLLLLRGEAGALGTKGGNAAIPASLLFRAGGTGSVRGYKFRSIGTVREGRLYPAKFLVTASAEYQHWFRPAWGGAVFYDVGLATDRWRDKDLFHAVGAGVRWRTPVGRLRVDLAYGLRNKEIRPHLSLGVAF